MQDRDTLLPRHHRDLPADVRTESRTPAKGRHRYPIRDQLFCPLAGFVETANIHAVLATQSAREFDHEPFGPAWRKVQDDLKHPSGHTVMPRGGGRHEGSLPCFRPTRGRSQPDSDLLGVEAGSDPGAIHLFDTVSQPDPQDVRTDDRPQHLRDERQSRQAN